MKRQDNTLQPLRLTTLLFVVLFLLIKLSPQYFAWQYVPTMRSAEAGARLFQAKQSSQQPVVVIDKSISEDKVHLQVPAAKCIGVLFILLFTVSFIVSRRQKLWLLHAFSHQWANDRLARLCVFRL